MSDSIYAPPKAQVAESEGTEPAYYVVGPLKFVLLSVLTFLVYHMYWFYRNWRSVKRREQSDIWPIPRGIFFVFFTHSLFSRVDTDLKKQQSSHEWAHGSLATAFVVLAIASNVLDRLSWREIGWPWVDLLSIAIVVPLVALLWQGQKAINIACGDPDGSGNSHFTGLNWLWMILGGLLWAFALFAVVAAVFAPELLEP